MTLLSKLWPEEHAHFDTLLYKMDKEIPGDLSGPKTLCLTPSYKDPEQHVLDFPILNNSKTCLCVCEREIHIFFTCTQTLKCCRSTTITRMI